MKEDIPTAGGCAIVAILAALLLTASIAAAALTLNLSCNQ